VLTEFAGYKASLIKSGTLEIVLCAIFRDAMSCGDLAWAADVDELIE